MDIRGVPFDSVANHNSNYLGDGRFAHVALQIFLALSLAFHLRGRFDFLAEVLQGTTDFCLNFNRTTQNFLNGFRGAYVNLRGEASFTGNELNGFERLKIE